MEYSLALRTSEIPVKAKFAETSPSRHCAGEALVATDPASVNVDYDNGGLGLPRAAWTRRHAGLDGGVIRHLSGIKRYYWWSVHRTRTAALFTLPSVTGPGSECHLV